MLDVAIVGAGPTGLYALRDLLRAEERVSVTLFESSDEPGLGTPYDPNVNHRGLLANIASFELPPVVETLAEWLTGLSGVERSRLGVTDVSETAFYPRVVLGAYFTAQYRKLAAEARRNGRCVTLRANTQVVDVACAPDCVRINYAARGGELQVANFDYAILATGHRSRPRKRSALTRPAYPAPVVPPDRPLRVGMLGASLTAIDVAISLAFARGKFTPGSNGACYRPDAGAASLRIEMISRRGVLPEADFYFPYPYRALRFCHAEAMREIARAPRSRLDRAFALLSAELQAEDPDFARLVGLDERSADDFADAYFSLRAGSDPFATARRHLVEVRENVKARRVSAYRYVILRAHEAFAELVPNLSRRDRERFRRGLQRVFVDNYAAVPPPSVERLLALHDAGCLTLRKIAPDYVLRRAEGGVAVVEGDRAETYDLVVDARGEAAADAREIPFPTLRLQVLANQMIAEPGKQASELSITDDWQLTPGVNPVERVYCLAAPFLLPRHPFVQGLTSAQDIAAQATARLLERAPEPLPPAAKGALYLDAGLIVATPN